MNGAIARPGASILIVGDVMLDSYVRGAVNRISPEAPVPVLKQMTSSDVAGGAANVAVNVMALGGHPRLFGTIGADAAGERLKQILEEFGIGATDLVAITDRPTTSKTRIVAGAQQIVRFDNEIDKAIDRDTANLLYDRVAAALDTASVLVLSDYLKGVLTDDLIARLIRTARERNVFVVVDPKRATFDAYEGADLIKPNKTELAKASGLSLDDEAAVDQALTAIAQNFGGAILVTSGADGMYLREPASGSLHFPVSRERRVADVSGAGDTALAALAVALAEGAVLHDAVRSAIVASGLAVTKPGTAIITRRELEEEMHELTTVHHEGALVDWKAARRAIKTWQARGETVVFTNGCFDLIHPGHIRLLEGAARCGDRLVVGLNSDASVRRLKGPTRPIQDIASRARVIGAIRFVDIVAVFDEQTPVELITALEPDVLVKGADYREDEVVGGDIVKARGGKVVLVDLVDGQSSSRLIKVAQAPGS
ncbi:MAG TPA: D-glycero-beta-D-manno-heptose 1-phosphate adenylyltransferase [Rhizomicrobium sp.]|nr:D-glycero-beta-D-manno-heptose 1-phosphate adenylyltransferase [Rhizomicrobium sp.]